MQIANSKKFEDTVLAKRLSASETDIEKRKQECWQTLCQLYTINPAKLTATKPNAWATLCQALVEDVFPGFNQTKKVGRKAMRNEDDCLLVYEMYSIAKNISGRGKDYLYYELADFESKRTGNTVTPDMIHNMVIRGKKSKNGNLDNPESFGMLFTQPVGSADAYNAEDVIAFLYTLAKSPKDRVLPTQKDPRSKSIYAKPLGKRKVG